MGRVGRRKAPSLSAGTSGNSKRPPPKLYRNLGSRIVSIRFRSAENKKGVDRPMTKARVVRKQGGGTALGVKGSSCQRFTNNVGGTDRGSTGALVERDALEGLLVAYISCDARSHQANRPTGQQRAVVIMVNAKRKERRCGELLGRQLFNLPPHATAFAP